MEIIKTEKIQERFRTVPEQIFLNFPNGFDPNEWEVYGYLQGEELNKKKAVQLNHFDQIEFWTASVNDRSEKSVSLSDKKDSEVFYHAIGLTNATRIQATQKTILVLKKKM